MHFADQAHVVGAEEECTTAVDEYSLSKSSSVNRLRVNFHTMNAISPMAATPPDTERPMMVDLLIPSVLVVGSDDEPAEVADADAVSVFEGVTVTNTVVISPCALVVTDADREGEAGGAVALVEVRADVEEAELEEVEVAVSEVDVEVSDVDVEVSLVVVDVADVVAEVLVDVLVSVEALVLVAAVSVEVLVSVLEPSPPPKGGKSARGATGAAVGNARAWVGRAAAPERRRALTERRTRHRARDREVNIWSRGGCSEGWMRGNYTSRRCKYSIKKAASWCVVVVDVVDDARARCGGRKREDEWNGRSRAGRRRRRQSGTTAA